MPRYRLTVEYDGAPYAGFQAQGEQPTIQTSIERAVTAFSGERPRVHTAGRTDSGVHATGQVVHIDLEKTWRPGVVRDAINAHLVPEPIAILDAAIAEDGFHARFAATERRYLYRIINRRGMLALDKDRAWHVKKPLDAEAMHAAAQCLVGFHDFTTFRDARCQATSPEKTLHYARVVRVGEEVRLEFAARSFLHRQVRSMTGSLAEIGNGRWAPDDMKTALEARDRKACGPVAPAAGLYLTGVSYESPSPLAGEGRRVSGGVRGRTGG